MRQANLRTARRACVALAIGLLLLVPVFGPAARVESPARGDASFKIAPTVSEWLRRPAREEIVKTLRAPETGPGGEQLALGGPAPSLGGAR